MVIGAPDSCVSSQVPNTLTLPYECLLKFSACLAVADCLNSRPPPEVAEKLVGLLLKPTGLSVGDWHSLLVNALKSLEEFVVDGALSGNGRVLPELLGVFFRFRCFVGT